MQLFSIIKFYPLTSQSPVVLAWASLSIYVLVFQAPAGIQVLMSATQSTYSEQEGVYQFYMEYPVPAYLVALVAGDLIPADIGPRWDWQSVASSLSWYICMRDWQGT